MPEPRLPDALLVVRDHQSGTQACGFAHRSVQFRRRAFLKQDDETVVFVLAEDLRRRDHTQPGTDALRCVYLDFHDYLLTTCLAPARNAGAFAHHTTGNASTP